MPTVRQITDWLNEMAPLGLAEPWDNVGLLVGNPQAQVRRVMTCLTVTPASAAEAVEQQVDLVITHHPLPFRPLKRVTAENATGKMLLDLIRAGVAVYSAHTAFDSAAGGINQRLAEGLGLQQIAPLVPGGAEPWGESLGAGRFGALEPAETLAELAERLKQFLKVDGLHIVGDPRCVVRKVGVACGSAGEMLAAAAERGCDCFVTGEARFHTCLEAAAAGIAMLLPGHFASERFAVEHLARELAGQFPQVQVSACQAESDPLRWA